MKKYELFLVLPGTLDENETAQKTGEVLEIINEFGQNAEIKPLGKNRLAYPIKQVRYGYFYTVNFEAEAENIKKIEDKLRLTRGLLRSIIYLYNKDSESAEKIAYFSQTSTLTEPQKTDEAEAEAAEAETSKEKPEDEASEETEKAEEQGEKEEEEKKAADEKKAKQPASKEKKIDLKEIDKKLDEILSDEDINI